jgi:hypothetical protein
VLLERMQFWQLAPTVFVSSVLGWVKKGICFQARSKGS